MWTARFLLGEGSDKEVVEDKRKRLLLMNYEFQSAYWKVSRLNRNESRGIQFLKET